VGLVGGFTYARVIPYLPLPGAQDPFLRLTLILAGLFALRIAEWWAVIALFFDQALRDRKRGWFCAIVGAIYSQALDVPSWLIMSLALHYFLWFVFV
jgi:hypothetical protein